LAQADDFPRGKVLDIQESAQGRNQPVAAVAMLVAVKPPLPDRLADEFQVAKAVTAVVEPIERPSGSMPGAAMAAHSERSYPIIDGWAEWFFRERSKLPDRGPNRARFATELGLLMGSRMRQGGAVSPQELVSIWCATASLFNR